MMFNFILLLSLGAFVIGSPPGANGPAVLGPGGSGRKTIDPAAFGPSAQTGPNFDPSLIAPGALGQGGSGYHAIGPNGPAAPSGPSASNVAAQNGPPVANGPGVLGAGGSGRKTIDPAAFGPAPQNGPNFDPSLIAPGALGQGGSGYHLVGQNGPAPSGPESTASNSYGPAQSGPAPSGPLCGPTEVYQECGVGWQCEDYCGRGPNACAYCEDGCYCKKGYIRSGPEYTAECIPENQCPRAYDNSGPGPVQSPGPVQGPGPEFFCQVNEVYLDCGGCDQYCNRGPVFCTLDCRPGCYCQNGYVRSFDGGICIPAQTCPRALGGDSSVTQSSRPVCGRHEIYQECGVGSQCEDYCGRGANACAYCEDGCYCKKGYIRSGPEDNAKCIKKNSCPRALN